MGCSLDADANPKIWLDSLLRTRVLGKLFTGNVTVGRQRTDRSDSWIAQKKLTIGSEKPAKSDGYDIA
jgi:hypothetical protein